MKDTETTAPTELLVCVTCRAGQETPEGGVRPGARLHAALEGMDWPDGLRIRPVECLSNCDSGCSVVLRGGRARWTYVYGRLDETLAHTLHDGASRYHATSDGIVPWRERPEHFKRNCIARIPPLETPE